MGNNFLTKVLGYSTLLLFILSVISIILFLGSERKSERLKLKLQETNNLLASTQDTLKTFRDENGNLVGRISTLETSKIETFLELQAKEKSIVWLQQLVAKYEKDLKQQGDGVIVIDGDTKIDTIYITESSEEEWKKRDITRGFNNDWVSLSTIIRGDSTKFSLDIVNKYSLLLGTDKEGKRFAEITNYNPYSTVETLRTYQISEGFEKPKPKRWGIGFGVGYSFNGQDLKPAILFGINRNLLVW